MEIKNRIFSTLKNLLSFIIVLIFAGELFAQGISFKQKLEWNAEPNALEYKVEINSENDSAYKKTITTKNTFVEFSIPAGKYRYRVFAYDFLGRQASVTEWKNFTITKALKPKIKLNDETVVIDKASKKPVSIPVDVESIAEESTIVLKNTETGEQIEGKINYQKDEDGNIVSKSATFSGVSVGNWKMVVTNPSGLATESENVKVGPRGRKLVIGKAPEEKADEHEDAPSENDSAPKVTVVEETRAEPESTAEIPVAEEKDAEEEPAPEESAPEESKPKKVKKPYSPADFNILAGFTCPYVLFDEYLASFDKAGFNPGINARISYLPIDIKSVQLGFEVNSFVSQFSDRKDSAFSCVFPYMSGQLNLVTRINFCKGKLGLNIKAGGGLFLLGKKINYNIASREDVELKYYMYPCASGGISIDWIPFKHLILEAGCDFTDVFIENMNSGFIVPYVCLGLRF